MSKFPKASGDVFKRFSEFSHEELELKLEPKHD